MKKIALMICLFALPVTLLAQLSFNTEAIFYEDANETVGVGGTFQLDVPVSNKFRPGIKAGLLYDVNSPEGTSSYQIPLSLVLRRYLIGRHSCWGGLYAEGTGGVGLYRQAVSGEGTESRTKETRPQASIGLGWRLPMLLDVAVSMGRTFDNAATSFVGLRANLRF